MDDLHDAVATGGQLRIGATHLGDWNIHELMQERARHTQLLSVAHRASHDLAECISAPLVGGHHPIGDQKGHGAQVVGHDAHRYIVRAKGCLPRVGAVDAAGPVTDRVQERDE